MTHCTRRQFLEQTILAATTTAAVIPGERLLAAEKQSKSPNDRIRCAVIGAGIRGTAHAQIYSGRRDCEVAYVCDADRERGPRIAKRVAERQGREPKIVADMRQIFDDKSVDVVSIAAPNHWHALAAIWAMQAGKDVYVEKPVSHNVGEGRRIVQTARKHGRICQAGTQHRGNGAAAAAIQFMREGKLGQVNLGRAIIYVGRGSIGPAGKFPVPPAVDYNLWAGPAPMAPITRRNFHYDWHWFWDFGSGELGNNGIHAVDILRWGLGVTGLGDAVMSYGGRLGYEDAGQTPNTQVTIHNFGEKTLVQEVRGLRTPPFHPPGVAIFYGSEGIIATDYSAIAKLFDFQGKEVRRFAGPNTDHFDNFLKVVRSRKSAELKADILEGHFSSGLCHVGNISHRLGRPASPTEIRRQLESHKTHEDVLETFQRIQEHLAANKVDVAKTPLTLGPWLTIDAEQENFVDNPAAAVMLTRQYRKPFVVPEANEV